MFNLVLSDFDKHCRNLITEDLSVKLILNFIYESAKQVLKLYQN